MSALNKEMANVAKKSINKKKHTTCGPHCVESYRIEAIPNDIRPLSLPSKYDWERVKIYEKDDGNTFKIAYKTPCGKTLYKIEEVWSYLKKTNSSKLLSIEGFDFTWYLDIDVFTTKLSWNLRGQIINDINPLAIPLKYNWKRLKKSNNCSDGSYEIAYKAPCGKMLYTMQEVWSYLRKNKSFLTIDLFDFTWYLDVNTKLTWKLKDQIVKDFSSGVEDTPISCVNIFDDGDFPGNIEYSRSRIALSDKVQINTDPHFLAGCDCKVESFIFKIVSKNLHSCYEESS